LSGFSDLPEKSRLEVAEHAADKVWGKRNEKERVVVLTTNAIENFDFDDACLHCAAGIIAATLSSYFMNMLTFSHHYSALHFPQYPCLR